MSGKLATWMADRIAQSAHSAQFLNPPPAVAGAGEVFSAIGPSNILVVYAAVRHGGESMRVGFAAKDRWMNEEVEDAVESNGGDMTEFIEDMMEADEDLVYKVQHFHDAGWFHFASDLTKPPAYFDTEEGRGLLWYYFDGYARAILPVFEKLKERE